MTDLLCLANSYISCLTSEQLECREYVNPLNTKRRLLYLKTQVVPRSKHFHLSYKNQSVYAVNGASRCLFSDEHKIQCGQNVQLLNVKLLVHHVTSRL